MKYKNLYAVRNSDFTSTFILKNGDNSIKNLTGKTVSIKIAKHFESEIVNTFPLVVTEANSGHCSLTLTHDQINTIDGISNVYSMYVIDSVTGMNVIVLQGRFFIEDSVQ